MRKDIVNGPLNHSCCHGSAQPRNNSVYSRLAVIQRLRASFLWLAERSSEENTWSITSFEFLVYNYFRILWRHIASIDAVPSCFEGNARPQVPLSHDSTCSSRLGSELTQSTPAIRSSSAKRQLLTQSEHWNTSKISSGIYCVEGHGVTWHWENHDLFIPSRGRSISSGPWEWHSTCELMRQGIYISPLSIDSFLTFPPSNPFSL